MKKLLLLIALAIPLATFAQRFTGGAIVGFNASQIFGDGWGGYNKAGLVAGAYVFTELRDKWGGQLEIRYSSKGSAPTLNKTFNRKIRLQYIEMPVLATYDFHPKFQAQGGVSISYLYQAEQNDGYGYEPFEQFDKFAIDINLGVRYQLFEKLTLNLRTSQSVIPIYALYSMAMAPYGMYSNVITFAVFYQIGNNTY